MGTPNAERQRQWRERQKEKGRKPHTFTCTPDEAFYLERVLLAMRKGEGIPAMVRNKRGHLKALDA